MILGIDPGPEKSAYVLWNGETWEDAGIVENHTLRTVTENHFFFDNGACGIEMIACYGMPVGKETFETCLCIGRLVEIGGRNGRDPQLIYRKDIKMHFCQSMKAKDSNIRQALLDRFGGKEKAIGKKATPGPLYGIHSHLWAALAVAIYTEDKGRIGTHTFYSEVEAVGKDDGHQPAQILRNATSQDKRELPRH